ncbi:MAG: hypothetical protein K0S86_2105 [Geminicoccaceae bacterium]|nr:hypothetical protein [Geminicoccaceae bacterium]
MAARPDNPAQTPADTLRILRRFVLGLFAIGIVGTAADLLLTGHVEDAWQIAPLGLFAASALVIGWHLARGGRLSIRTHQAMMSLFILSGFIGTFLHYRANIEFEMEMYPGLAGFELFWKAIQGASPPSLAPGTMIALGLLGLMYAYRHPALDTEPPERLGAHP